MSASTSYELCAGFWCRVPCPDSDSDGLSDCEEAAIGTDPNDPDSDGDGVTDGAEVNGAPSPKGTFITDPLDADTDDDGCTDGQEEGADEALGGRRSPLNHWDYFNPTQDGINRTDDITAVVLHYGHDDNGDPLYGTLYDRSPLLGANPWQFGPPDGTIRTADISAAVRSYGHDCGPYS